MCVGKKKKNNKLVTDRRRALPGPGSIFTSSVYDHDEGEKKRKKKTKCIIET